MKREDLFMSDYQIESHWTVMQGMSSTNFGILRAVSQASALYAIGKVVKELEEELQYREEECEQVISSIQESPFPDRVSMRVVETECSTLRGVIRELKDIIKEPKDED